MKELMIKLDTFRDVQELVAIIEKFPFPVDLMSGRYIVDAKSIMGIYSLDLLKPIKLVAHEDDADLFSQIEKFKA